MFRGHVGLALRETLFRTLLMALVAIAAVTAAARSGFLAAARLARAGASPPHALLPAAAAATMRLSSPTTGCDDQKNITRDFGINEIFLPNSVSPRKWTVTG
jgi:hypothetical protein